MVDKKSRWAHRQDAKEAVAEKNTSPVLWFKLNGSYTCGIPLMKFVVNVLTGIGAYNVLTKPSRYSKTAKGLIPALTLSRSILRSDKRNSDIEGILTTLIDLCMELGDRPLVIYKQYRKPVMPKVAVRGITDEDIPWRYDPQKGIY